jgi:NADH-quinone oxidoreductase subunit M
MLGSVALPLTNGFPGEFLLLKSVFNSNKWLGIVAGVSIILGAVYMLRMVQHSMFGAANAKTSAFEDVSGSEVAVLLPIAFLVIFFGLAPNMILEIAGPTVKALLQGHY